MNLYLQQTFLLRSFHDGMIERSRKQVWYNGYDVYVHVFFEFADMDKVGQKGR
jgi:hypothetical protein